LGVGASGLVSSVVRAVLVGGRGVSVGCAVGADALVLRVAAWVCPSRVRVFAVGERSGRGFWRGSALGLVRWAAGRGVSVSWAAGGPVSGRLPGRLLLRSLRCVGWAARSGPGCGLVAFVVGGWRASPGSWRSVRAAVRLGVPVVVFPVGCSVSCFPRWFRRGVPSGSWVVAGSGVWSSGFRFVPGG